METDEDQLRQEVQQLELDGERMCARIAQLESQLAQLTAERDAVQKILDQDGYSIELGGGYASICKNEGASLVKCVENYDSWHAALAALVDAAGREESK